MPHALRAMTATPPVAASVVPALPMALPRARRALVIDDDALSRRMLHDALTERGFEVITACDGVAGLSVLCEELLRLDVLVTDLYMPALDGASLVRRIRGPGGETDLVILLVTAAERGELAAVADSSGADAVLRKGLGPDAIARVADALVARKRAADVGELG
jgi:CheY-like chemotaxis protein